MRKASMFFGTLLASLVLLASPTFAFQCDPVVDDEARLLGGSIVSVEAAAKKLTDLGAEVRLRTIPDSGNGGNLDLYIKNVVRTCPSWQSASGDNKSNLIVIAIEVAHKQIGVYNGDLWVPALETWWQRIKDETIRPRLRDGDFAGAFISGVSAITDRVNGQLSVARTPPPAPVAGPVIVREAADLSGLWSAIQWLVGAGILAALIGAIFFALKSRAANEERRRAAQTSAQTARSTLANAVRGFDETGATLSIKVAALKKEVSPTDAVPVAAEVESIVRDYGAISTKYASLADISANDPNQSSLTTAEYERIELVYSAITLQVTALEKRVRAVDGHITRVRASVADAPKQVASAETTIKNAEMRVQKVMEAGFKTSTSEEAVRRAKSSLAESRSMLDARSFTQAISLATKAIEEAGAAATKAESLPALAQEITQKTAALNARIRDAIALIETARPTFERITNTYAETCWRPLAGNGTEAERKITAAQTAVTEASAAATMERQEWEVAQASLAKADTLTGEASQLLRSIVELEKSLGDAKRKCPNEIGAASADIEKAQKYLDTYASDIDKPTLEKSLGEAMIAIREAREGMQEARPDYLKVIKLALSANHAADKVLEVATAEHETMERKRRNLTAQLEEADRSIGVASAYINQHVHDLSTGPSELLTQAVNAYAKARSGSLDMRIEYATAADKAADKAYEDAQNEVRRAKKRREDAREEERGGDISITNISYGGSTRNDSNAGFSTTHSGGGLHGGSSGFGSSGGLKGGSSSW